LNSAAAHYCWLYYTGPSKHFAVAVWEGVRHLAETNGVVLSVWWPHWPENLRRIPTVTTARTLLLCCVFSNSMHYSVACDVWIVQVMYKLRSLTTLATSVSWSKYLQLLKPLTFVNSMVLGLGVGLCLLNTHMLLLLIRHFGFFNMKINFNTIFPPYSSSTYCYK